MDGEQKGLACFACMNEPHFDSARDREIIFWQRIGAFVTLGILIPLLALIGFLGF